MTTRPMSPCSLWMAVLRFLNAFKISIHFRWGCPFHAQLHWEAVSCQVQGSANRRAQGLVNFVLALAYHFCLNLPAAVTQPGACLLVEPCITTEEIFFKSFAYLIFVNRFETHLKVGKQESKTYIQANITLYEGLHPCSASCLIPSTGCVNLKLQYLLNLFDPKKRCNSTFV